MDSITCAEDFAEVIQSGPYAIRFPNNHLRQDEEWCLVRIKGDWQRIRLHDYHEVFRVPGLYESIFYRTLRCHSPYDVAHSLRDVVLENDTSMEDLRIIDFGAGNGMVGEALLNVGAHHILGADILPEAKAAALRDRPWVYDDYIIADFNDLTEEQSKALARFEANALVIVAALGFGDIPPDAFLNAFEYVKTGGWVSFNIKEDFLENRRDSAFSKLIHGLMAEGVLKMHLYKRYRHRLSVSGEPLYYATLVMSKHSNVPRNFLAKT